MEGRRNDVSNFDCAGFIWWTLVAAAPDDFLFGWKDYLKTKKPFIGRQGHLLEHFAIPFCNDFEALCPGVSDQFLKSGAPAAQSDDMIGRELDELEPVCFDRHAEMFGVAQILTSVLNGKVNCAQRMVLIFISGIALMRPHAMRGAILDADTLLHQQSFWDNQDWDWYKANIAFFECPDAEVTSTYYYRWELVTKHLTYGSPTSGYSFTEFIDRPFWSGAYGAISCPAGHQLYELRWLRDPQYARDYSRYWFRTPGAEPRQIGRAHV